MFNWADVDLRAGSNTIDAIGTKGGQTYTDSVTWTVPAGAVSGGTGGNNPPAAAFGDGLWAMSLDAAGPAGPGIGQVILKEEDGGLTDDTD